MPSLQLPSDAAIQAFWSWFQGVAGTLADSFENEQLQEELDEELSKLGELGWELGPGLEAECALAISPDGDVDWLPITTRIVALAPELPRWEFHPARQARPQLELSVEGDDGEPIEIDAHRWRYVLIRFPDGIFDIIVEQNDLAEASEDERYAATVALLDGLLGEATMLARIQGIEPVAKLSSEHSAQASAIVDLPAHLAALLDA
jgi:hypothetical protein